MKLARIVLPVLFILCSQYSFSQTKFRHDSYNLLGIQAGFLQGGITTNNFSTTPGTGFTAGLTTRSNIYQGFIASYGINFYSFNTSLSMLPPENTEPMEIDFKATGVQLNLFAGHKIIGEHLSIMGGPVLQLNGEWEPDEMYKDYKVEGYDITASDIADISKINFNLAAAVSAGLRKIKVWIQYQYGMNNILKNLNTEELLEKDPDATNLRGRMEFATAGIVFYF